MILMGEEIMATGKAKEYFKALFVSLVVGTIAGLVARYSVFPVMAILNNKWFSVISPETVKIVYFWIGQVVGSLALVIYMYSKLREYKWSKFYSIIFVIASIVLLIIVGLVIGALLATIINE
jgi:hypothetical protein